MLTVFQDAHTHRQSGQEQCASGHTTLGGGIKIWAGKQKGDCEHIYVTAKLLAEIKLHMIQ